MILNNVPLLILVPQCWRRPDTTVIKTCIYEKDYNKTPSSNCKDSLLPVHAALRLYGTKQASGL